MATTRIMSLHTRADPPGGGMLIFPPFLCPRFPQNNPSVYYTLKSLIYIIDTCRSIVYNLTHSIKLCS